jgi:hypothetical protein
LRLENLSLGHWLITIASHYSPIWLLMLLLLLLLLLLQLLLLYYHPLLCNLLLLLDSLPLCLVLKVLRVRGLH